MRGLVRAAFVFAALFAVLASRRGAHAARPVVHDPRRGPSAPRRSDVARAAHLRGAVARAAPDRLVAVDVDPRVASIDSAEGGDLADLPPPDSGAIPKVIHLLWKTDELPEFAREFVHSWVRLHPSWQVRRWTDASMLAFVRAHFPGDEAMWRRFPTGVFRADTFRYMVLRVVGGVYVDLDVEALRSMDELIEGRTCLIGQEPAAHAVLLGDRPRHACNAWMASAPGEPFWDHALEEIRRRAEGRMNKFNPPSVTGPEMLDAVLERTGYASPGGCGLVDPPEVLYPAVDKSALATLREKCDRLSREEKLDPSECPPHVFASGKRGKTTGGVRLGEPGKPPTAAEVCCRLAADGWANPSRETVVARGSYAVHHWVHTWLRDDATSNAWRRRT